MICAYFYSLEHVTEDCHGPEKFLGHNSRSQGDCSTYARSPGIP
jgi:hypothetical protein